MELSCVCFRCKADVPASFVRAIACGRAWFEELSTGRASSFGEIAARVGVTDRYVSRIVDLAIMTPDVIEAVLKGDQRSEMTVKGLTVDGSVQLVWNKERRYVRLDDR